MMQNDTTHSAPLDFASLLHEALEQPGTVNRAYFAFHGYSLGNQLLALVQCAERGIEPGPIATFPAWKEKGRYVRKGEKALSLCMPITCKRTSEATKGESADDHTETFTRFIYKPRWFVLAQTDGADFTPDPLLLHNIEKWLRLVKAESDAPDLWELAKQERAWLSGRDDPTSNVPFTATEREEITRRLQTIEEHIDRRTTH